MRTPRVAVLRVLSVSSAACASRRRCCGPTRDGFDREAETKAVYALLLNELHARERLNREVGQWVVDPAVPAVLDGRDEPVRGRITDARPDTLADFERPRPAGRVPADLDPGRPVRWFTGADVAALPRDRDRAGHGWAALHEKLPRSPGRVTLSHIEFSADGTEALVQPGCWFDSLGGAGSIVRLQRVRGAWRARQRLQTVIS